MEKFYEEYYVLQYPNKNNKFVAIDNESGGYPYANTLQKAEKLTFEEAKKYLTLFTKEDFIVKHVVCEFVLRTANN